VVKASLVAAWSTCNSSHPAPKATELAILSIRKSGRRREDRMIQNNSNVN
jgi:hypothetical protein